MAVPYFIFTSFTNAIKVAVPNLEKLSVAQIQEIESFVLQRKGVFDFATYTFSIQKRIDFFEFEKLVELSGLEAILENKPRAQAKEYRVGFGQYKGMHYSELSDSYLLWLKTNYNGPDKDIIATQLKKRKL